MGKAFYLTTTLPYVNAVPHLGHALEFVQADAIVRYRKSLGEEVFFNTGTDEHGLKVYLKAEELHKTPQAYADETAENFKKLLADLHVEYTRFIRTTEPEHMAAAQEFWRRCEQNGDIYLAEYKGKYCVGCELEKTDSDLVDGKCPDHPNLTIEEREEENYFFRFSKYQKPLLELYGKYPDFVLPEHRLREIRNFVATGLRDFSISRVRDKMPWGIPVPGNDKHVMYVWFDALINYISTLNWPSSAKATEGKPDGESKFEKFWGTQTEPRALQIAGKDNLRQQTAMWQAMLMSADLPTSRQILIHGHIMSGGVKMSKTIGNVIDPVQIIQDYGAEALRYWFLREMSTLEDGDFTADKFKDSYNSGLANGLGNTVSRILKMAALVKVSLVLADPEGVYPVKSETFNGVNRENSAGNYQKFMESFELQKAMDLIWATLQECDQFIQKHETFRLLKSNPEQAAIQIQELLKDLWMIARWLQPFLPQTSRKILAALEKGEELPPLFPRKV